MNEPKYPALYQVNTRVWINRLSQDLDHQATLDDIPDTELDQIAALGFDWIYLLGAWQTGAAGQTISRTNPEWRQEYQRILPDLQVTDICGSCFAIKGYTTSAALGGDGALARLRKRLHQRGLRIMLDFVPNHTAPDHPWVFESPDYFVHGSQADLEREPENFTRVDTSTGARVLARGRDPNFPGWADTLQLDYSNLEVGQAMIGELLRIATQCDGLRCDMAMLILPEIFLRTWGKRIAPFWPEAIRLVRQKVPGFIFMAEVYWDLEATLQGQGFDYTYDKSLYDHLRDRNVEAIRGSLNADLPFQKKCVRFLENHDEGRAASTFSTEAHPAAAILAFTSPGLRFFHQGQLQGRRIKTPIHLCRAPEEPIDPFLDQFYTCLLGILRMPALRQGTWRLWKVFMEQEDDDTWSNCLAYTWQLEPDRLLLVIVNYSAQNSQCCMELPLTGQAKFTILFHEANPDPGATGEGINYGPKDLHCQLQPWGFRVIEIDIPGGNP